MKENTQIVNLDTCTYIHFLMRKFPMLLDKKIMVILVESVWGPVAASGCWS